MKRSAHPSVLALALAPEKVPAPYSALHGTPLLRPGRSAEAIPRYGEAPGADTGSSEAALEARK